MHCLIARRAATWCWTPFWARGPHLWPPSASVARAMGWRSIHFTSMSPSAGGRNIQAIMPCMLPAGKHLTKLPLKRRRGTMAEKSDSEYAVGYGKPPQHTRFKPSQPGNPTGRKKKSTSFEGDVDAELCSSITVLEGGERRRMTKRRSISKQHVNRALKGTLDPRNCCLKLENSSGPIDGMPWTTYWKSFVRHIVGYRQIKAQTMTIQMTNSRWMRDCRATQPLPAILQAPKRQSRTYSTANASTTAVAPDNIRVAA